MTKAPIGLQDLQRKLYGKAKAEPSWRFWGLYVHVCKPETLSRAYALAKANNGAPGIDGVTFATIEQSEGGVDAFLAQIRTELLSRTYQSTRNRKKEIPKGGGKVRVLGIPTVRDRVVQGALKLILEPIFEADFQPGSFGYRPGRSAHEAVDRVAKAIAYGRTRVIDVDLRAFFDNVRHDVLLTKVGERVNDGDVMRLLKQMLKATGPKGVPQGGVISPLLANVYLNEVDRMLERAQRVTTTEGGHTHVEYARYADDLVILVDGHPRWAGLLGKVEKRLREELAVLHVEVNEEKSRIVDLTKEESFGFLGFDFRRERTRQGRWSPRYAPKMKKRTELLDRVRTVFRAHRSQPLERVVREINPILRGWVAYFAVGHASRCFHYVRDWVLRKARRHLLRARKRQGFGWKRWSTPWLVAVLGLFDDYRRVRWQPRPKALTVPWAP